MRITLMLLRVGHVFLVIISAAAAALAVAVAAAPSVDMSALLLEVVADKPGYPAEILRPELSLEADLGIDRRTALPGSLPDFGTGPRSS